MRPSPDGIEDAAAGMAGPDDDDLSFQAQGQSKGRKKIAPAHQEPDEGQGLPFNEPAGKKLRCGGTKDNKNHHSRPQGPENDLGDIFPLPEIKIIIIQLPDMPRSPIPKRPLPKSRMDEESGVRGNARERSKQLSLT